jgi:glycolate oxidase subunit GlcD
MGISNEIVGLFRNVCGTEHVLTDAESRYKYESDQTFNLRYSFDVLVKPGNAEETAKVLSICNRLGVPVTARGGGSGVTGGALPFQGGVVLSTERLNKIITVNKTDRFVLAEAGVVTADLCDRVEQEGLYFPVAPSSSSFSFIGGNVAHNAGSIRSCKYGKSGEYVLNLQVALPNGELIWTGSNNRKNSTGLNLTQLFVGSEGILGIITKVVYRLLSKPVRETLLLAAFDSIEDAYAALIEINQSGMTPCIAEWIGQSALRITAAYLDRPVPLAGPRTVAQLLVGLDTVEPGEKLESDIEGMAAILQKYTRDDILFGDSSATKDELSKVRFSVGDAMVSKGRGYRDVDVSLPLSMLYSYVRMIEAVGAEHGVQVIWFGHALDGNLHTMILTDEDSSNEQMNKALAGIYDFAVTNGGVISGEHGIGLLQKGFMEKQFTVAQLNLMKGLKSIFDPQGVLNPGKMF